jgi:predicted ATPase/DNA-binding winged helix-turn-helix (wHTH) protein
MLAEPMTGGGEYLCFGPFRLSRRRRSLESDAGPVALGARAFDLLTVLLDERGRLLSKNELLDRVWPGLVVEENNLHVQMVALRRALGPEHGLIQTVPGRGYRFAGVLEPQETAAPAETSAPAGPDAQARPAQARPAQAVSRAALPAEPARLIGREAELAELQSSLRQNRLVTITGPGGIGKTRLAVALGNALLAQFPGGARLIDLAPLTDATLVEGAAAAALGIRLDTGADTVERICAALAGEPALLLFDNCEHLLDGVAALVAALLARCEAVSVLAPSQEPLRIEGEVTYRLDPLALPPSDATRVQELAQFGAVNLFVRRVQAADRRFKLGPDNSAAVAEICRCLDGIPLALEMAAARVPALGIEGLRLRLGERLRMLTSGARNAATRHRTLRDTVAWSYELLDAQDQAVFRRLGVFAGGFSAEAAAAVLAGGDGDDFFTADADEWVILDALGRLIEKSLVVAEPGEAPRYRLLETLRLFAIEQLAAHGEQAAFQHRHAAYFERRFALAHDEWEDIADALWLDRHGVELDNVRTALDWTLETPGTAVLAVSLAGSAAWLWDKVAPLAEGRRYLERAETLLALGVPPEVEARLHRQIGNLWHASDRPRALAALQRAEVLYRELNDRGNLGAVLALGGFLRSFLGASKTATQALQEARTILEATGRRKSLLNAMNNLGVLAAVEGDMQAARDLFEQALLITRTSGDRDTEIMVLVNLAEIEFNLDQIDAAVERAGSAVTQLRGAGRQTDLGWALTNLATYLLISGRLPEAARAAGEGLNLVRPAGGFILRVCLLQWALLAANAGQLAAAARLRGFVEAGYKQAGETLQPSEQRLSDRLNSLLEDGITAGQLAACFAEGEAWSEAEAAAFAASLGAASVGATRKYELPS